MDRLTELKPVDRGDLAPDYGEVVVGFCQIATRCLTLCGIVDARSRCVRRGVVVLVRIGHAWPSAPRDVVIVMDNRTAGRPHLFLFCWIEEQPGDSRILAEAGNLGGADIGLRGEYTALGVCTAHHHCAGAGAVQALCAKDGQAPGIGPVVDRLGQALPDAVEYG